VLHKGGHNVLPNIWGYLLLITVLLTVLSFAYVPFHVLTEDHTTEHFVHADDGDEAEEEHHEEPNDHHAEDGHIPHPETDHSSLARMEAKLKLQPIALLYVLWEASQVFVDPERRPERVPPHEELLPTDSPPERFSPRGPPVA